MKAFLKKHKSELLFLLFVFLLSGVWAFIQPFDVSPDEAMRYDIPEYICAHHALPVGYAEEIRNETWGISYAYNPILSYIVSAGFMLVTSRFFPNAHAILFAARLVSVLSLVGMAFMVMLIGKRLFKGKEKWLFICGTALLPQMVFLGTYVNTDAMAMLSTAVIVYAWVCAIQDGWNLKNSIVLAAGISVCALSYYNAYGFILCSMILFVATNLFGPDKKWDYQKLLKYGLIITAIVCVCAGWWFVRNYMIYDGDFLGRSTMSHYAELYAADGYKPSQNLTPEREGISLWAMLWKENNFSYPWIWLSYLSFIGIFGNLAVPMSDWIYVIYSALAVLGVVGIIPLVKKFFALQKKREWRLNAFFHWTMLLAMLIPCGLYTYYAYASDFQSQGRYAMPMLIPLIYFLTKGQAWVLERLIRDEKKRSICYSCIIAAQICLPVIAFCFNFLPVHWTYLSGYLEAYFA